MAIVVRITESILCEYDSTVKRHTSDNQAVTRPDRRMARSRVTTGWSCARAVPTITRSAWSRRNDLGSRVTSSATAAVIGRMRTARGSATRCSHRSSGTARLKSIERHEHGHLPEADVAQKGPAVRRQIVERGPHARGQLPIAVNPPHTQAWVSSSGTLVTSAPRSRIP